MCAFLEKLRNVNSNIQPNQIMPRASTVKAPTVKSDSRLEFAKALSNIVQKQDAFNKAIEAMKEYTEETLTELDLKIANKEQRLEILDKEFETLQKNKEIELDQHLKEHKYDAALEYLEERKQVPIDQDELKNLRELVKHYESGQKADIDKVIEEERQRAKTAMSAAMKTAELSHKADTAELNATVKQLQKEIETYQDTISNQKEEIAEQRKLTMQVAQAGAKGSVNQTFGGK